MKRGYWLSAALLLFLGLFFYFCVFGYSFAGLFLCLTAVLVLVFGTVDALKKKWPKSMKCLYRAMSLMAALVLMAMVVTGIFIGSAAQGDTEKDPEYVIVLGAGVNGTVPSLSLRERLEAAENYLNTHPDAIAILSGGMGDRENISEAACMYNWLTHRGMDESRLWMEDQSTSTEENLRFSLALIEEKTGTRPAQVGVVSSEYHLYRAGILAEREGAKALGVPARTSNPAFFCNMFVRETFAVWFAWLGL